MSSPLPSNVHVSQHPCLLAKLSQFRSGGTNARDTKALVQEMATILGVEALAKGLGTVPAGTDKSPLGYEFDVLGTSPARISVVPILRSGLGMLDAIAGLLPAACPVHHLGLFREPTTLQPVEYYNNLPYHSAADSPAHLAIVLDPIIATGGTAVAAVQTLREWGVSRILFLAVLGTHEGVTRAAREWSEGVEVWVAGLDAGLDARGMIRPGCGDVGDRLFGTKGK